MMFTVRKVNGKTRIRLQIGELAITVEFPLYPYPIAGLGLVVFVELASYRIGFQRTNDPYGNLHLRPGNQVAQVPPLAIPRSKGSLNGRHRIEQPGGILREIPTFILEDYQRVFAVRQQEVEEGALA